MNRLLKACLSFDIAAVMRSHLVMSIANQVVTSYHDLMGKYMSILSRVKVKVKGHM